MANSIHSEAFGEHYAAALYVRSLRTQFSPERSAHLLIVEDGRVALTLDDIVHEVGTRSAVYLPPASRATFTIGAGTNCYLVGVSPELLVEAIGNKAESVLLRIFSERPAFLPDLDAPVLGELLRLVTGFLSELHREEGGSWMGLSAYWRLILMTVWRNSEGSESAELGQGQERSVLQTFRQLVEIHFRDQWPVGRYAKELGLTHDRLHAVCTRILKRTPLQLIHQRLIQEARLRLERSGSTIQLISHSLGFGDATYFSHFFKRNTGQSPAAYRRDARSAANRQRDLTSAGFADWP